MLKTDVLDSSIENLGDIALFIFLCLFKRFRTEPILYTYSELLFKSYLCNIFKYIYDISLFIIDKQ